jgi:hypothetical protein
VAEALANACPGGISAREALEGQHRNPIIHLSRRLEHAKELHRAWDHWRQAGIPAALLADFQARIDSEGILHFRIDKQRAYQGVIALAREGDMIDVRVKLKAFPAKASEFRRVVTELLEGP